MKRILIANRGEIASRVINTCKRLGIETIAVYSEADADMPFVEAADKAFLIGPPPVQQSYLKGKEILAIAVREGVDGIHPGYGLLSENADFAELVQEAGIKYIGPDAETIAKMGDKIVSRRTMEAASVPVVPGTDDGIGTLEEAILVATDIGYPIMLKASAGGGGVGMVRCESEQALSQQFETVKNRAKMYFGNDNVFIEKFITNARHIEVQVFGDDHGNIVHLFERNCSVQRRNQKVIEESPSPMLPESTRERLYKAAVDAAKAVNYKNAGTVEFIVDENDDIYFLEMNTRLQVEHPVTEEVTGYDLVEWQIEVAKGNELPETNQENIKVDGHALEFRVYAEDPNTFMPSPGTITKLDFGEATGVRIDSGYAENGKVTPFYDPLISKVIVHADTRGEAIEKAKEFFTTIEIEGLKTNIPLFTEVLNEEKFRSGAYTTAILEELAEITKGGKIK
ncbi:acetyl-CoA carboxylase biotin carboxylase subunit [Sporosarcina sp. G11-34]|uniref:acetyl-CoA carboxylase biotin carboxylase subunit n=1 Tax=Sporosarcina sp. G11-34 TaxID=2849605 RepID=UPI0022A8DC16|nr:biotin carboxylase N-terminal domain-containing protein [Sporosarcina sp. G11-34]MCZ2257124.1 ATP-grasp domain-containing protein [Sporosarcina sp. G11-34]